MLELAQVSSFGEGSGLVGGWRDFNGGGSRSWSWRLRGAQLLENDLGKQIVYISKQFRREILNII